MPSATCSGDLRSAARRASAGLLRSGRAVAGRVNVVASSGCGVAPGVLRRRRGAWVGWFVGTWANNWLAGAASAPRKLL
jgi:hypothetical protein